ncbi:septum site-determining protein MinC [Bacillus sp. 1P06AnD]|uniref:septum site-determining protein MinC n=1 Tax=Bacillus sp. 1P06AnD TaxID=3132208 RepID=UPI00399FF215
MFVINNRNMQNVMIKGTKDGLTLHLDNSSSFEDIIVELKEKLSSSYRMQKGDEKLRVNVHTGNRQFSEEEQQHLISVIENNHKLKVEKINSNVISLQEASNLLNESEIKSLVGIIRSGQVIEVTGDLLLIGDVNSGGVIRATGNIFVVGTIKGRAHAGSKGDKQAVVAAGRIVTAQISIADVHIATVTAVPEKSLNLHCAYLDDHQEMKFEQVRTLRDLRPNLTRLEGGL